MPCGFLTYGDPFPVGGVGLAPGQSSLQRVGDPAIKVGRHAALGDGAEADALICTYALSTNQLNKAMPSI